MLSDVVQDITLYEVTLTSGKGALGHSGCGWETSHWILSQ